MSNTGPDVRNFFISIDTSSNDSGSVSGFRFLTIPGGKATSRIARSTHGQMCGTRFHNKTSGSGEGVPALQIEGARSPDAPGILRAVLILFALENTAHVKPSPGVQRA